MEQTEYGILSKYRDRISRRRILRYAIDKSAKRLIAILGTSVIFAILLIFFYLFSVVLPLFQGAKCKKTNEFSQVSPHTGEVLHLDVDEYNDVGVAYTSKKYFVGFKIKTGSGLLEKKLDIADDVNITSVGVSKASLSTVALGLSDGTFLPIRHEFEVTYEKRGDVSEKIIRPKLDFAYGETPIEIDENKKPIRFIAIQKHGDETVVGAITDDLNIYLLTLIKEESFLTGEAQIRVDKTQVKGFQGKPKYFFIDDVCESMYIINEDSEVFYFDIKDKSNPTLLDRKYLFTEGKASSAMLLLGGVSLIVGSDKGEIRQYFAVKNNEGKKELKHIRTFKKYTSNPIILLVPEKQRKGFIAVDSENTAGLYFSTSNRLLLTFKLEGAEVRKLAFSSHGDAITYLDASNKFHAYHIDNKYPEISWSSLWGKVWYEGYQKPEFIWQSSAAVSDYEHKYSLVPLTFGTFKAAFYSMLFAVPIALMGAIATGYFLRPALRQAVKPTVEIMEALPTVILGFLAGLWLAPLAEQNLPGVILIIILTFPTIILTSLLFHLLPEKTRSKIPYGIEPLLSLIPLIIVWYICMKISPIIEVMFFKGDVRIWLTREMGIPFDQRNSLVVGIAMGIAVIPNIFSIAEDAVFGVPKHLTEGSLALGATPWQTLWRIVLPAASPGIFSAIMIGLGRAVGETMIVLMATGNTPVIDFSIFQGLRALSANIAVEMPEAPVGSTHYRILFLSAFVLLSFTFLLNTIAEFVRQNLRAKYGRL